MFLKILGGVIFFLVIFLVYVASRDNTFHYQRSGLINAPAEKIFPYLSDFTMGSQWSPYEKIDPNMKKNIIGSGRDVGSVMEFDGNKDAGSGKLEFLKIVPNETVEIKLTMTKPFAAENLVKYQLTKEGDSTRFTWEMSGQNGFLGKLIGVLINCDKMIGGQFEQGIQNLKALVEGQK